MNKIIPRRALIGGAAAFAATRASAATVTGKVIAQAQANSPWDRHWDEFKTKIAAHPDIAFEYYLRGETGNEEQMLTALRRNRVQFGAITMWGLAGIIPEAAVPMLPFLFKNEAEVDFVFDNFLVAPITRLLREKDLVFLHWGEGGWSNLYSRRPVVWPTDIRGLKVRASPNLAATAFLEAVGANPVPLGIADIAPALQTGLVDGGLAALTYFYYSLKDFATDLTLLKQCYDQGAVVANTAWWDTIDRSQREVIAGAFVPPPRARADIRGHGATLLAELVKSGTRVHELTAEQRSAWTDASKDAHERVLADIGGRSREVYAAIQEGKRAFGSR